ncbi:hypothetical protein BDR26DRAFT_861224 [Obelidium mucronatum]|nr:hypothetical protein BDR26DRAFT_861224 [Obelidium mucronatum]
MFSFFAPKAAPPMPAAEYCTATGCSPNALSARPNYAGFPVLGDESLMAPKNHGSCTAPPMAPLRFGADAATARRICCHNRHYAERAGSFLGTDWLAAVSRSEPTTYYDSVSGKPLFRAPIGRSFDDFLRESSAHGWPSFRDSEVVWDNVRVLRDGECVSTTGTHLGHNIPDGKGNRYCINLVSVAGSPVAGVAERAEL